MTAPTPTAPALTRPVPAPPLPRPEPAPPALRPGPANVTIDVICRHDRFGWGMVSDTGVQHQGLLEPGATRVDAQLAAVAGVLAHPDLADREVLLLVPDEALWLALNDLRTRLPRLLLRPMSMCVQHPSAKAARARAHLALSEAGVPDAQESRPPAPSVTVATDGSMGRGTPDVGWGWVSDEGQHDLGTLRAGNIVAAELAAIRHALSAHQPGTRLRVLVDSRDALALVARARRAARAGQQLSCATGDRITDRQVAAITALLGTRTATFDWVRAHAGHPLNEGADRLAVLARRCAAADVPVTTEVAERIVAETRQALTAAATAAA